MNSVGGDVEHQAWMIMGEVRRSWCQWLGWGWVLGCNCVVSTNGNLYTCPNTKVFEAKFITAMPNLQ